MPRKEFHRRWCQTCFDWKLFELHFEYKGVPKNQYYCQTCANPHQDVYLKDIPTDKILEQRERFKIKRRAGFLGATVQLMSGNFSNLFSMDTGSDYIIESDAGLKKIEEREGELRRIEYQRRKDEIKKFSRVGRNDICLCGSGKKYKKCCLSTIESYF